MNDSLIELIYKTYYSTCDIENEDTLKLLKIICEVPEETILSAVKNIALKVKDEHAKVKDEHAKVKDEHVKVKDEYVKVKDEHVKVKDEHVKVKDEHVKVKVKDEHVKVKVKDEHVKVKVKDEHVKVKDEHVKVKDKDDIFIPQEDIYKDYILTLKRRQLSGDQGSSEWLNARVNYITASVCAACAGIMGPQSREMQILNKATMGAFNPFKGGYYTDKGNIFEDLTANHYSLLNNTKVHDFRLIPHYNDEYSFLGASTDGVTDQLINIEIKTLENVSSKTKKEYSHQMQHQMECLNLKKTHFLEAKYEICKFLHECTNALKWGIILEFWVSKDKRFEYVYLKEDLFSSEKEYAKTITDKIYIRSIYWKMVKYQQKTVLYDKQWIVDMGPAFKEFWAEVLYLRKNKDKLAERIRLYESKKYERKQVKAGFNGEECLI